MRIRIYRNLFSKIPHNYRGEFYRVMLQMFLKALLNFAGVATLLYLVAVVILNDSLKEYLPMFALLGVAFLLGKGVVVLWIDSSRMNFLLKLYKFYSVSLLEKYYREGLLSIRQKGVANIVHDVNNITFYYVDGFLRSIMNLICEGILLGFIALGIFIYSPGAMLCAVGVFLPISLIYVWGVQRSMTRLGRENNELSRMHYMTTENTFRGFAEVEINQAYDFMQDRFLSELESKRVNALKLSRIRQVPSLLLEVSLSLLILFMVLWLGYDNARLGVSLGLLSVAALRTLPSIKSMLGSWNLIKNTSYSLDVISKVELRDDEPKPSVDDIKFNNHIELRDVSFRYLSQEPFVLSNLSLEVRCGEFVGIRGESGCGKSTVVHLMQGFFTPTSGGVYVDDVLLEQKNKHSWHKMIGYVPQDVFVFSGSILENVVFGTNASKVDRDRVYEILAQLNLKQWVDSFAEGLDHQISGYGTTISGGQKQRLGIARALYKGARVLFFDEATSSLDAHSEMSVINAIDSLKKNDSSLTMIIVAHRESTLTMCDRVINIQRVRV